MCVCVCLVFYVGFDTAPQVASCLVPGGAEVTQLKQAFADVAGTTPDYITLVAPDECPALSRQADALYLAKVDDVRLHRSDFLLLNAHSFAAAWECL